MLTYKSLDGSPQSINVLEEQEQTIMETFMWYLDMVVHYKGQQQKQRSQERSFDSAQVTLNRPSSESTIRALERELAVNFLARRMAPKSV